MADNTKSRVLSIKTELDPSGITSGATLIRQEIAKLTRDVGTMMGAIQKSINNAISPLNNAASTLAGIGNTYTNAAKQMSAAAGTAQGSLDGLNRQITSMSTRSKNLVGNMNNATTAVQQFAGATKGINSATISFRNYTNSVSDGVKLVNGQFDATTRLVRSLKNDILDLGRIFAMVTAGFVGAVALPTKAFGDFQKELLTLKNLANDFTAKELETFRKTALDVAVANGLMAKDIAASGIELVRLGLNAKETNLVLRQVADAALANSISIVKAAEVGLGATKAMGLGVNDLSKVLNVLTRAAVSSATDIEGLSQTFKYAAPIFNSAEQDINELAKASIILSNNMIRNSQAGTTLRSMMLAFQAPTVQAQKVMQKLGLEIKDVDGNIKPFSKIMGELSGKLKGVDTATKNWALSTLFGKYALSGATALVNSNADAWKKAEEAVNNASLTNEKMADGMRKGVIFEFNQMRAAVNNASIALGEKFAPEVERILQSITDLAQGFSNLPDAIQQQIADMTILTGKITIATAGIVGLTLAVRSLINFTKELGVILGISGVGGIVGVFHGLVTKVSTAVLGLASAFSATSAGAGLAGIGIGAVTATIATLAAGVLALAAAVYTAKEGWDAFMATLAEEKAWETAGEAAEKLTERLKEAEKATRKLQTAQDAGVAPEGGISALEMRRAASREKVDSPKWKEMMAAARARDAYDESMRKRQAVLGAASGLEPDSEQAKQNKAIADKHLAEAQKNLGLLKKYNMLSEDENAIKSAEVIEREQGLKNLQSERMDKEKQREADKASAEEMRKVRQDIADVMRKQKEDYEKQRKKMLSGAIPSDQVDTNLGAVAEEVAKTRVKVQRVKNECVIATEETMAAMGATNQFLEALTPGVDQTISNLEKLAKAGLGKMSSIPSPGAIALKPGSHAGIVGKDTNTLIHSSSTAGYKFAAFDNYLKNDKSVKYFTPSPQLFNQGSLGASGVSRENMAVAQAQKEKKIAEQTLTDAMNTLKKKQALYKEGTEMYRAYETQIEQVRTAILDAENDAAKKEVQLVEEARKKMETIFDENNKAILSLELDAQRKLAEIRKETLSQRHNEIDQEADLEIQRLKDKFGAYQEVSVLIAQEEAKRVKKHLALNLEEQATLTKMVEDGARARAKAGMLESEREMFDIQLEIADLQRRMNQQTGPESEKNKQLLAAAIEQQREKLNISRQQLSLDLVREKIAKLEIGYTRELNQAQSDLAKGKITQSQYDSQALEIAHDKIRNAQQELDYAKSLDDLNLVEKKRQILAAEQALIGAQQNLNELKNQELSVLLKKIEADKKNGVLSNFEAQTAAIAALDNQLAKMAPGQLGYNQILADRNNLLMQNKAATGDFAGMLEAMALKTAGVNKLSQIQLTLFEGLTINGEKLKMGAEAIGVGFGKLIETFSKYNDVVSWTIEKTGQVASAFATMIMGIVSNNPVQVIGGVVQALAMFKDAMDSAFPSEAQMKERQNALVESLIDIELQAEKTETRLRLLRGEITELQAAIADQTSDAEAKQKRLEAMKLRRDMLTEKQKGMKPSGLLLSDINPVFGMMERGMRESEFSKISDELTKLNEEIAALDNELKADLLENAQTLFDAKRELSQEELNNLLEIEAQKALATEQTADDVEANYKKAAASRAAEMVKELEDAKRKGLDIQTIVEKHKAELAAMEATYNKELADAKEADLNGGNEKSKKANETELQQRADHLAKMFYLDRDQEINLAKAKAQATYDRVDDIKAEGEAERKAAGDKYRGILEQVTGNSKLELKIKANALQQYLIEIEQANLKEQDLIDENAREKAAAIRDVAMLQAENSRNTTLIMQQELTNQYADLEDWKAKEMALAKGDFARKIEIEEEYAAKRIQINQKAEDKIKDMAVGQLNDLKSVRELILKTQSLQYEDAIQKQERFLLDLNKQRDDLQRQIEFYDNQIAKQRETFNRDDKSMFMGLLGSVDIPAEIRKGLELIANPEGVPNTRFSRQSQMQAIQERVDMLRQENENLLALEDRSEGDYWKEESRIALIEAATANEMLTDSVTSTKLTAKEKLEIQSKLADAYKRFQEAQLNLIEDGYTKERKMAESALLDNKIKQDERNAIIADNKFQIDQLTMTYQQDMAKIESEVLKINVAHNTMKFGIDEVSASLGNMTPFIDNVKIGYDALKATLNETVSAMQSLTSASQSYASSSSSSSYGSGSGSSSYGSSGGSGSYDGSSNVSISRVTNSGQSTAPAGYPVTDGNYWYSTTSDMYTAQSFGLKEGGILGMIPNQDRFKGDKFPLMPGVNGNAGELLVSPIEKLRDLMPAGNNYNIMVTGNTFKDEVDFRNVMMEYARERNLRDGMSSGQFMSNLRR